MDGEDRKVCWGRGCPDLGILHKVDGCAGEDQGGEWARTA